MRDTEEHNGNGISVCVTHRYGDNICFPKNIHNPKTHPLALCVLVDVVTEEEDIGPVDRMVTDINNEGKNISDSTLDSHSEKFSPESILTDQHKLSHTIRRTNPNIDTLDKVLLDPISNTIPKYGKKNIYKE